VKKSVWTGRVISVLVSLVFVFSGVMKVVGGPELDKGMEHLELAKVPVIPLAILELTVVAVYMIPQTAVLGAILLTGYLGGTILTAWRVGDPVYVQVILGILVWLGIYLREERLRALIPFRTRTSALP
jgi:DoxX-like protein